MLNWLKSNPIYAGIILIVLLAIVAGTLSMIERNQQREEENLVNLGASQEREAGNKEVLNNVGKAKEAGERPTAEQLNSVCSKYDRNCNQNGQ